MKKVELPGSSLRLYADISTDKIRPYIPPNHRYPVFRLLHDLSHPGIRASQQLVCSRFIWRGINKDIRNWTRKCLKCQSSEVTRHTISEPAKFQTTSTKFEHVHIDIVGPLPSSNNNKYILTCVDRFTRWPEAIPIPDIYTNTIAKAFIEIWIARFGVPLSLTSDRGSQFESNLWSKLMTLLGIRRYRTTSYHPQGKRHG